MNIIFSDTLAGNRYEEDVWQLLCQSDKEFVPPLSCRESTTQTVLHTNEAQALPYTYFKQMQSQMSLIAVEDGRAVGIMSYRYGMEGYGEDCAYISTIIVNKDYRGRGITGKLYQALFEKERGRKAVTRTWSTNNAHLHLLEKLGFVLTGRLKDHRGPGIDTVYYAKENAK